MPNAQTFSPGPGILLQPTRPAALYKVQRRSAASSDVFLRQVHLLPLAAAPDYKESSPPDLFHRVQQGGEHVPSRGRVWRNLPANFFENTAPINRCLEVEEAEGSFWQLKARGRIQTPHKSSCVTFRQVCARSLATMYYYTYTRRDFSWMQLRGCSSAQVQAIFGKDSACLKYKMGDGACGEKAKLAKMTR